MGHFITKGGISSQKGAIHHQRGQFIIKKAILHQRGQFITKGGNSPPKKAIFVLDHSLAEELQVL